ncbi:6051_t:CDS:1, partial [Paraglomus brasilianum]
SVDNHVDITVVLHMCEAIFTKRPAILALIAGDGDITHKWRKPRRKTGLSRYGSGDK